MNNIRRNHLKNLENLIILNSQGKILEKVRSQHKKSLRNLERSVRESLMSHQWMYLSMAAIVGQFMAAILNLVSLC